jgi:magnesium transporter
MATDIRQGAYPAGVIATAAAGDHVTRAIPIAAPDDTAEDVRLALLGQRFELAGHIAVVRDGRLAGLVAIEDLLAAPGKARLAELMDVEPPVAPAAMDQEHAVWLAVEKGESSVAVVDDGGTFLGMMPPHRLLAILHHEHGEDMARLGGYVRGSATARRAAEEPVLLRFWHKLPWLLIGLVGTFLAADIVARFDERLKDDVILAFFLPGVVYLADAVGTQTETVVIRGLSVNIPLKSVLGRESLSGLLVGTVLALVIGPLVLLRWGRTDVALAVAISLFVACSVATLVAMTLPAALQRLGRDPAFGSGPLATVVQDILSIAVYLVIATAIVD